jgi:ABC-type transporter Mla subunit MlaD
MVQRLAASLTERQTQGIIEQVQAFADPVGQALTALAAAVEELAAEVATLRPPLHAVLERQAVEERLATQAAARRATSATHPE